MMSPQKQVHAMQAADALRRWPLLTRLDARLALLIAGPHCASVRAHQAVQKAYLCES